MWLLTIVLLCGLLGLAAVFVIQGRLAACRSVPLLANNLLPNPRLEPAAGTPGMPAGWSRGANGIELRGPGIGSGEGFDLDGDGRALQLIGIANFVQTPPITVSPETSYCFAGRALTDSDKRSTTRLQVDFRWLDGAGTLVAEDSSSWQPVVLWTPEAPPAGWAPIHAAFQAPPGAATLQVRLRPASDDRVYLDAMQVQWTTNRERRTANGSPQASAVVVQPWPNGARAAVSFSFDWETAMGGLIHSRSVDDPNFDQDPLLRGMRMREGVTTTLALWRDYNIRATYYANGYNFLLGNTERRTFMGDPTFAWARTEPPYNWRSTTWLTTPWFARDPYGTVQSDPAWYFGDLVPLLQAAGHDIQSHTFSHFYGGFANAREWRADLDTWRTVAAEREVPPARSLAFPWSSSAGMSDDNWHALAEAGITSATRTNRSQPQYQVVHADDPHCRPLPGHEAILACPDFYLTPRSAPEALQLLDRVIATQGMIDLWAHTEEVTSPEQIAAWRAVAGEAARRRDAGTLWIAPLAEIADWQQALENVRIENVALRYAEPERTLSFRITNGSSRQLKGLTVQLPFNPQHVTANGAALHAQFSIVQVDLAAGQTLEVLAWPV
jgi:hypothetical protein